MADSPKKDPPPPAAPPPGRPPGNTEMPRKATGQARVNAAAIKAKIAFQGDDEFSVASLAPEAWHPPVAVTDRAAAEADPKQAKGQSEAFLWKAFRKVFGR